MFETKDSGQRAEYASGMVRDTEAGKARFDLILPRGIPYFAQMLTRFADLMARGAEKYDARNWEKAEGEEELERYRSSALRHLVQWATGESDEDHAAAVMFNLLAAETVKYKKSLAEDDLADSEYMGCAECGLPKGTYAHNATLAECQSLGVCARPEDHHSFTTEVQPKTNDQFCPKDCTTCEYDGDFCDCDDNCCGWQQKEPEQVTMLNDDFAPRVAFAEEVVEEQVQRKYGEQLPWSNDADINPYTCTLTIPHRCRVHPEGIDFSEEIEASPGMMSCCEDDCWMCGTQMGSISRDKVTHILQCNVRCAGCAARTGKEAAE